ncbi:family 43 glycosylhydrolase [Streptomyces sp. B21-097]|uniref:family 43 glycosylhydrolase n=1 Tax=Streptomyces sp. B21-097 TaxID=3039414 RepID=UPI002FF08387
MRAAAGRVGADGAARADRKASYSTATSTSRKTLGLEAIEKGEWEMLGKSSKWKIASLLLPIALALAFFGNNAQATASASAPRTDASVTAPTLQNDVFWKDTSGNPIYSQGGGVLKVGSTYYWYGVKYNGAVTYYNNPAHGKNGDTSFSAITSYSSTDLVHWKFEGNVMTSSDLGGAGWVGRVGVAHNPRTGKYVLISQLNSGLVFATSSTPAGHFTRAGTQSSIGNVTTGMSGDQSVFTDDDGNAYLVFSNKSGRSHLYVAPLRSSDFLHVEAATNIYNSSAGGREGNIMFKHDGTYYFCSSDLHGWNASHTYCITSTKINGPYSSEFVMQGTDADFSHVTQTGLAFQVTGASGSFVMFGGDRWSDFAGNGIGYNQWLPVTFNGKTPIFHSLSQWNVDAAAGTWSVAGGNNHVLNPSFEADRVSQNKLAGWTNQTNGGSDPNSNSSGGNTGRWAMTQYRTSAYTAVMYQDISLPNGTYTLSAWVKSSGGQKTAKIFAKNFGASEMNRSISQSIGSWTKISISGIDVTNGSIQVGVSSDANAGNRVNVDDFSLVQTGGTTASGKR